MAPKGICVLGSGIWRRGWQLLMAVMSIASQAATPNGFGHYQPPRLYSDRLSHSLYVPMRDGVRLAVRISQPALHGAAAPGRFPVIWQHTITSDESGPSSDAEAGYRAVPSLTEYGYVVVQVARRGNGQSFGVRRGYNDRTEDDDAYEMTEWLARQPWSNGTVGIYGCSNTGDAAMHALSARPPHLKAVFAGCFSWSKFDAFHRGGIYAQWGVGITRSVEQDMMLPPVDGDESRTLLRQAAEEHQASTNLPELWKGMPYRDSFSPLVASRFWYEGSISSFAQKLRESGTALYIQGGWHDELRDQGLITWLNYPRAHLLIGPWAHCLNPGFELLQEIHRFFDTYLKGLPTGMQTEPPIHYFLQQPAGGGQWRTAERWPLDTQPRRRWYLADLQLQASAPSVASVLAFDVDASERCPNSGPNGGIGPYMQPCHHDHQGASFSGAALEAPLTVIGHPIVQLYVQVSTPDAHVFAYLEDVAPDGSVQVVTEGRLRVSTRAQHTAPWAMPDLPWHRGWAEDELPSGADETVPLSFDLMPTAYVFAAGHRVALTITGYDYRESAPRSDQVSIRVHSAPDQASVLELPVLVR